MRNLIFAASFSLAAALCIAGLPAFAGGYTGANTGLATGKIVACADLAGRHVAVGTSCVNSHGVVVTVGAAAVVEVRRCKTCADPHRPSDSVFVNGSGYLIKDTVRARLGCP